MLRVCVIKTFKEELVAIMVLQLGNHLEDKCGFPCPVVADGGLVHVAARHRLAICTRGGFVWMTIYAHLDNNVFWKIWVQTQTIRMDRQL